MLIVRASDGASWTLYRADFNAISTLAELRLNLLSPLLSIPPECIISMNEEGAQLRDDTVASLRLSAGDPPNESERKDDFLVSSGVAISAKSNEGEAATGGVGAVREKRLYVFDRDHLDGDPEEIARALAVLEEQVLTEPPLTPQDPLHSHIGLSEHNLVTLHALLTSLVLQRDSLSLALSNLSRVLASTTTKLTDFFENNTAQITHWRGLLEKGAENMDAVSMVGVVSGLISRGSTSTSTGGTPIIGAVSGFGASLNNAGKERERFLGDYVSRDKMVAVREGCAKVLDELQDRLSSLQMIHAEVLEGTDIMKSEFDSSSFTDLEACEHDAEEGHYKIQELVRIGAELSDPQLRLENFEEMYYIDQDSRERIRFLVDRKNAFTRYLVLSMQRISVLQSSMASVPMDLGALDHDFKTRTENFKHLTRLEGMIPAYIATVAEVVRRRLFTTLLQAYAESMSGSLVAVMSRERTRRLDYRAGFAGKLPWEIRGLGVGTEEDLPRLGVVRGSGNEELPDLDRAALETLQNNFVRVEETMMREVELEGPISRARIMLEELVAQVDRLGEEFIAVVPSHAGTAVATTGSGRNAERESALEAQIRQLEESNESLSRQLQAERTSREEELIQLEQRTSHLIANRDSDEILIRDLRDNINSLEVDQGDFGRKEADWEKELGEMRREEGRNREVLEEVVRLSQAKEGEFDELRREHSALEMEVELTRLRATKAQESVQELQTRYDILESELSTALVSLSTTTNRLQSAESMVKTLATSNQEKERKFRDQQIESELDRAGLENELRELHGTLEERRAEVDRTKEGIALGFEATKLLERKIDRLEVDLSTREGEKVALDQEMSGKVEDLRLMRKTAREAMSIAGELRMENLDIINALTAKPDPTLTTPSDPPPPAPTLTAAPIDFENGDLDDLLMRMRAYEKRSLTEAVKGKVESLTILTRKWQKECKNYRDRAHRATSGASEKIAFRNFAKGDLALFLPTRNSTAQIWAAFNVSFPHHFLSATGVIGEQIKSREWIVARITSLEEKIVDVKDPASNPFLLAPGTKFFLLEVEGWSSKEGRSSRKHASSIEKGKGTERKTSGGHSRVSKSESTPRSASAPLEELVRTVEPSVLVDHPSGSTLGENGTTSEMARSGFAVIHEEPSSIVLPPPEEIVPPPPASGISISLARSLPTPPPIARSDPFSSPFASTLAGESQTQSQSPSTIFEPTLTSTSAAAPAFLPSISRSARYNRQQLSLLARSPGSTSTHSHSSTTNPNPLPRSVSSSGSFLSASMHHHSRSANSPLSTSPPSSAKAAATTAFSGDGTGEDSIISSAWTEGTYGEGEGSNMGVERRDMGTMTVGRSTKGFEMRRSGSGTGSAGGGRERPVSVVGSSGVPILDALARRKSPSNTTAPAGEEGFGASEVLKRLNGSTKK